jgi:cyanate permease
MTLLVTLRIEEDHTPNEPDGRPEKDGAPDIWQAFKLTLQAGGWILKTPFALVIIMAGLMFDNCIRMVVTLNSQYYRLINLPEASFGLISSGMAVLGLVIPLLASKMVNRHTPTYNLSIMAGLCILGLIGMTFFMPYIGLLPVALLTSGCCRWPCW